MSNQHTAGVDHRATSHTRKSEPSHRGAGAAGHKAATAGEAARPPMDTDAATVAPKSKPSKSAPPTAVAPVRGPEAANAKRKQGTNADANPKLSGAGLEAGAAKADAGPEPPAASKKTKKAAAAQQRAREADPEPGPDDEAAAGSQHQGANRRGSKRPHAPGSSPASDDEGGPQLAPPHKRGGSGGSKTSRSTGERGPCCTAVRSRMRAVHRQR